MILCSAENIKAEMPIKIQNQKAVNPVFYLDIVELDSVGVIVELDQQAYIKKETESAYTILSTGERINNEDIIELSPEGKMVIEYKVEGNSKKIQLKSKEATKWFVFKIGPTR